MRAPIPCVGALTLAAALATPTTVRAELLLDDDTIFASSFDVDDCARLLDVACDGTDGDFCREGVVACPENAPVCSDLTSTNAEQCNGLDDDCDAEVDEDFVRNTNPVCETFTLLNSIPGDTSGPQRTSTGQAEAWYRLRLTEQNNEMVYLSATVSLDVPNGTDYDLYVYCTTCGGGLAGQSTNAGDADEQVTVRADDEFLIDDAFDILIEVRHVSSSVCATWSLTILGDTTANAPTCP